MIQENFDKLVQDFLYDGFVILKKAIPPLLIDEVMADVKSAIKNQEIKNTIRDIHLLENGEISSAHNLVDYVSSYVKIQNLELIQRFAKSVLKSTSTTPNSSYFAKPKRLGLATKPHQDNAFFCMKPADVLTFWYPVEFSDKRNGGLYYLPGSHRLGNVKHDAKGNLGASMCINKIAFRNILKDFSKKYIELKKGDCVVHNALVIHGSDENLSEFDRKGFNFSIVSKNSKRDEQSHEKYISNLGSFLKLRKQNNMA